MAENRADRVLTGILELHGGNAAAVGPRSPAPSRAAGGCDRAVAERLPELGARERSALALVDLAGRSRVDAAREVAPRAAARLAEALARARKELRRTLEPLAAGGWCERAERLISDRLDGALAGTRRRRAWTSTCATARAASSTSGGWCRPRDRLLSAAGAAPRGRLRPRQAELSVVDARQPAAGAGLLRWWALALAAALLVIAGVVDAVRSPAARALERFSGPSVGVPPMGGGVLPQRDGLSTWRRRGHTDAPALYRLGGQHRSTAAAIAATQAAWSAGSCSTTSAGMRQAPAPAARSPAPCVSSAASDAPGRLVDEPAHGRVDQPLHQRLEPRPVQVRGVRRRRCPSASRPRSRRRAGA